MKDRKNRTLMNNGLVMNGGSLKATTININNATGESLSRTKMPESMTGDGQSHDKNSSILSSRDIRHILNNTLLSDSALNAFIIDFFPNLWRLYISDSMDRMAKLNILLAQASMQEISDAFLP